MTQPLVYVYGRPDCSRASALQVDENKRVARWNGQVAAGYVMVSEARRAFDLPVRPEHEVFLRPLSVVESGRPALAVPKAPPLAVARRPATTYGAGR